MLTGFSECTAIATSLIPLDTILPETCAVIIGFSCTVWTQMRYLAGSLADGVLADTSSSHTDTVHQEGVIEKSMEIVQKAFTS